MYPEFVMASFKIDLVFESQRVWLGLVKKLSWSESACWFRFWENFSDFEVVWQTAEVSAERYDNLILAVNVGIEVFGLLHQVMERSVLRQFHKDFGLSELYKTQKGLNLRPSHNPYVQ